MKYAEYICLNLARRLGYTHCFFVAGGNIMHFLDAAHKVFDCIPVVHEVAAGIAAEYFNATNDKGGKALALVTAGPGITNIATAIAGAFLESRELLVIGGQVKTEDLKSSSMRQRGIQEIDGVEFIKSISTNSIRLDSPETFEIFEKLLLKKQRPGPVFVEIPLNVQGASTDFQPYQPIVEQRKEIPKESELTSFIEELVENLHNSKRPVLLLGGGLSHRLVLANLDTLVACGIPIMTTWNGMDRYGGEFSNYWGRPNTWGQRSANILIQQSDLIIALGTRLGMQQTGFAWREFAPLAKIFQVDIDNSELEKGHPRIYRGLEEDANEVFEKMIKILDVSDFDFTPWLVFGKKVRATLPVNEASNITADGFVSPYLFVDTLSKHMNSADVLIPCSSGGAFTVTMQAFTPKFGQRIVSNKGLASMGYGLPGAIGACISTKRRVILIEGDGGFAQNLQELGSLASQNLSVKIFLFSNDGYASIRMTQKSYFGGNYFGCDQKTGLGLPDWQHIANAYKLNYRLIDGNTNLDDAIKEILATQHPEVIEIKIDPNQTYYPKINSRVLSDGSMVSNPLHLMSPELSIRQMQDLLPYLMDRISSL